MIAAAMEPGLLHALALAAAAGVVAIPFVLALAWLPAGGAATLAGVLVLVTLAPLPPALGPAAEVAPLLAPFALPPAWGLRRIAPTTQRIAASLAGPWMRFLRVWLPLVAPSLAVGLAWGVARALGGAGFPWPAALLGAASAWPALKALAERRG
jgi:hypothetical protein